MIVESPTKSRTLTKFLGRGFAVMASNGHIMDLPKSKLGVDLENGFEPQYEPIATKQQTLQKLQAAAKTATRIYLAPDPDREGEAIAWHLAGALKSAKRPLQRLTFNEITERAVKLALENPRELDLNLVNAQQARRVLDRLVGYKVSPFLWKTMFFGLSAGRVQSVALRLICEREDAIEAFVPVEYWTIEVDYQTAAGERFTARLARVGDEELEQAQMRGDDAASRAAALADRTGEGVGPRRRRADQPEAGAPATAVHHQHAAADGVQPARIHEPAHHEDRAAAVRRRGARVPGQRRTHHLHAYRLAAPGRRGDRRVSRSGSEHSSAPDYVPESPRKFKGKKSAQDAHEAIRPSSAERTPESLRPFLTEEQFRLYDLIWKRAVASQVASAEYLATSVDVEAGPARAACQRARAEVRRASRSSTASRRKTRRRSRGCPRSRPARR